MLAPATPPRVIVKVQVLDIGAACEGLCNTCDDLPMEIIATTMDRQFREIFQKMQRGIYASEPYEYLMVDSVSSGREAMVSMMVRTIVFS